MNSLAGRDWFEKPALKRIFTLLNADGGEVRIVGGAVRNALMDLPVVDVDMATTLTPDGGSAGEGGGHQGGADRHRTRHGNAGDRWRRF